MQVLLNYIQQLVHYHPYLFIQASYLVLDVLHDANSDLEPQKLDVIRRNQCLHCRIEKIGSAYFSLIQFPAVYGATSIYWRLLFKLKRSRAVGGASE